MSQSNAILASWGWKSAPKLAALICYMHYIEILDARETGGPRATAFRKRWLNLVFRCDYSEIRHLEIKGKALLIDGKSFQECNIQWLCSLLEELAVAMHSGKSIKVTRP